MPEETVNWEETARKYAKDMEYYRGICEKIGKMIGKDAFVCDDGSISQDVLVAKLPELITKLVADRDMLNFLDSCTDKDKKVCMRESIIGRGWRLHVISQEESKALEVTPSLVVRDAIQRFKEWTEL